MLNELLHESFVRGNSSFSAVSIPANYRFQKIIFPPLRPPYYPSKRMSRLRRGHAAVAWDKEWLIIGL